MAGVNEGKGRSISVSNSHLVGWRPAEVHCSRCSASAHYNRRPIVDKCDNAAVADVDGNEGKLLVLLADANTNRIDSFDGRGGGREFQRERRSQWMICRE